MSVCPYNIPLITQGYCVVLKNLVSEFDAMAEKPNWRRIIDLKEFDKFIESLYLWRIGRR